MSVAGSAIGGGVRQSMYGVSERGSLQQSEYGVSERGSVRYSMAGSVYASSEIMEEDVNNTISSKKEQACSWISAD